jgi:hypothetical protein
VIQFFSFIHGFQAGLEALFNLLTLFHLVFLLFHQFHLFHLCHLTHLGQVCLERQVVLKGLSSLQDLAYHFPPYLLSPLFHLSGLEAQ